MWGYNKPNNYGGYQTCVVMHRGVSYKFDDDKCGQTEASYVCEIRNYTAIDLLLLVYYLDRHGTPHIYATS